MDVAKAFRVLASSIINMDDSTERRRILELLIKHHGVTDELCEAQQREIRLLHGIITNHHKDPRPLEAMVEVLAEEAEEDGAGQEERAAT